MTSNQLLSQLSFSLANRSHAKLDSTLLSPRRAGVAIILRIHPTTDALEILYIRRAWNLRDRWSGHMAFPGGKAESGESDQQATERETLEEIGLDLQSSAFKYLGVLDDREIRSPITRTRILVLTCRVYLQTVSETPPIVLSPKEVADIYWVDIKVFLNALTQPSSLPPWRCLKVDIITPRTMNTKLLQAIQPVLRMAVGHCLYAGVIVPSAPPEVLPIWGMTLWLTSDVLALAIGCPVNGTNVLATRATGIYSMFDIHWCMWISTLGRYPRRVFVDQNVPSIGMATHHAVAVSVIFSAAWKVILISQMIRYTPRFVGWLRSSL
ncbi:hypothetical protein BATDEDRAFT_87435 [Batrachochytrium dendrobatidis JAM81]|uniref:Nudix hydrolase domain-containing protein n=2 Tax=Batrachochytrium dendrobatidis TaxID=109871 RepID=F4P007_BATDJ|nr:uncharacterized protein BATDEDRAFT_87435 [Batrachochytrium dendrobatidis JAM81]EGF81180.1 hypothetical protein BATDEDRAFT_87435 [Batrachochytrium dendrobatidis JAM81]|eukprot:XP_006678111.1 hypothetical protein BATDEDRAFT_87435 [Batrachochytrium dendrobatidis JAM81]